MSIITFFKELLDPDACIVRRLKNKLRKNEVDPVIVQDIIGGASGMFGDDCLQKFYEIVDRGNFEPDAELLRLIKSNYEQRQEKLKHIPPRQAIRLIKTDKRQISKFGGNPNLPDSVVWPLNPEGVELDFLAQIYFPEVPTGLGLPKTGTLFIFYDYIKQPWGMDRKDSKYWKLIYTEEPLPPTVRERRVPREEFEVTPDVFIKFEVFESHCSDTSDDSGHHQMLGYPLWIQDGDMASDKLLLLQLDTDEEENGPDWMWGDMGRLFFWIKPSDLAARRFDRVELVLECY